MVKDINKIDHNRCLIALTTSSAIALITFIGLVVKLLTPLSENTLLAGADNFRYFTVLSAMLVSYFSILCIPFEVQGLKQKNYHLPRWIVDFLYVGVCCSTMTFLISVFVIAPARGVRETLFSGSLLYLHLLCPLLSLVLFLEINVDHKIKYSRMIFPIGLVIIYAIVYYIEVFVKNRWLDHYYVSEHIPIGVLFVLMLLVIAAISYVLIRIHNKKHEEYKQLTIDYYMNSKDYAFLDIFEAIRKLASNDRHRYQEGDISVPVRIIRILKNRYNYEGNDDDLYNAYISEFLNK